MSPTAAISLFLILANIVFSWKGLTDDVFFSRYRFNVERILVHKEYRRLVSSGFLHVSWTHLFFNMISLYAFSASLESYLGSFNFLLIYFASLVCGNLFSLFIHRNHSAFSSVGASGAVCGVIFACIALFPGFHIGFFILPVSIPAWLYGLVFVLFSIYGIRSKSNNVGHEAHLAGAVIGMLIAIAIEPSALVDNYLPIIAVLVPSLVFIYMTITRPHVLLIDNHFFKAQERYHSIEDRYNAQKIDRQKEIDHILDKIHKKGMESLTKKEKETLDQYSKTVR
jgi:membrane associated rhomboid family serine protease